MTDQAMNIQVLVVDNNPVFLKALSTILIQEGCAVTTAANGLEALSALKGAIPDIVFTDLVMPQIGGEQLCKIIRSTEELCNIFLVVVSAIVLEDLDRILADQYYDLCIAKGNLREIRSSVKDALDRFRARDKAADADQASAVAKIPDRLRPSMVTQELLSERRHLAWILDNLNEGIIELNRNGIVVAVNAAAITILACRAEQVIGSSFQNLAWGVHQEVIANWLRNELVGGSKKVCEIFEENPWKLGKRVVTVSCIPITEGGEVFAICILRDISRQYHAEQYEREMEDALRIIKKMDAMSCMAGGIAHDFNNLLTVICGNLDIIALDRLAADQANHASLLQHARDAAYMAVDLTRKISCFSPYGITNHKDIPVDQLVMVAVGRYFGTTTPCDCSLEFGDTGSTVNVDQEQLVAALFNVLQNAREASADGEVRIRTSGVTFAAPAILSGQYVPAGRYVRIDVIDQGPGIDRENILKIFDPYYSTKERGASKGMGLGLTVVYATLRNHGGYVVVESVKTKGTTVSLFLPDYGSLPACSLVGADPKGVGRRVLLVERDDQLQSVGRIMLEYLGHAVTVVSSVVAALNHLRLVAEQGLARIDCVLLDVSPMEEQHNDKALCQSFLAIDPALRLVATGAGILDPIMQDCQRYGFVNALPKPFTMDSLRHVLAGL